MVGVIAAVSGKVECNRQTLLAGSEVTAVEGVRFGCGGEACVLADCPGAQWVHGAVRSTQEGGDARHIVEVLKALEVGFSVYGLHGNEFGREPLFAGGRSLVSCAEGVFFDIYGFKIRSHFYMDYRRIISEVWS